MTERYKTLGQTTLAEDLDDSETAVDFTSISALRNSFTTGDTVHVVAESEIMVITAEPGGNTGTVTRGAEGTSAASHANGTTVKQILTAGAIDQIKLDANIPGIAANHGFAQITGAVTLAGSSDAYAAVTGLTVSLPSAGTYLLIASVLGQLNITSGLAYIFMQLRNTTDGAYLSGSIKEIAYIDDVSGVAHRTTSTHLFFATVNGAKTIDVHAARGFTGTVTESKIGAYSSLAFIKLSDS